MQPTTPPLVNGQTFAQASAGITDRAKLGEIARQFQSAGATNQLIVTGSRPSQQFASNTQDLNRILGTYSTLPQPTLPTAAGATGTPGGNMDVSTYSDPYTSLLDRMSATSDKATQNLIATIKAQKANRMREVNDNIDRYKQGLMSLGLETGNINFTPDLVYGSIQQAENNRMTKLQDLDRDEASALIEAQQAADEKDFKLLSEKMDYIRQLKKDKLDAIKELAGADKDSMDKAEFFGDYIYDSIKDLSGNQKQAVLQQLSQQTGIPVMYLVGAASSVKQGRIKKTGSGGGTTATLASDKNDILKVFNSTVDGHQLTGSDGYVDPQAYIRAYEQWGHGNAAWLTAFDPKKFVNPKSYDLLPEAIRPKKTGGIDISQL